MAEQDTLPNPREIKALTDARRTAETFVEVYQVTLIRIEQHLEDIIEEAGEEYAEGYEPWRKALHELLSGSYKLSKETEIPDKEQFDEALRVFSFDSSIAFIKDICEIVGVRTDTRWPDRFRTHLRRLIEALEVFKREKYLVLSP